MKFYFTMESAKLLVEQDASVELNSLFSEAMQLSSTVPSGMFNLPNDASELLQTTASGIEKIWNAQYQLKKLVLSKIPDAVRAAAAKGLFVADVLVFQGSEKFKVEGTHDEFPLLFLLKGPTDPEQKSKLVSEGFAPLLPVLQNEVKPFDLRHSWTVGTNCNKITVTWRQ